MKINSGSLFVIQGDVMKEFLSHLETNPDTKAKIDSLRGEVESFARTFSMPGFDER